MNIVDADLAKSVAAKRAHTGKRLLVLVLLPLIAVAVGLGFYVRTLGWISTDNAYVKAHKIAVSAEIAARIAAIDVQENEVVRAGQILVRLDPAPLRIGLARAAAEVESARLDIESLRASYREKQAATRGAEETLAWLTREVDRQSRLAARNVLPETQLEETRHRLSNARENLAANRQAAEVVRQALGGNPDLPAPQHPRVKAAEAARDKAALDLAHVDLRAPTSGIATRADLRPGEWVVPGQPILALVTEGNSWIDANFKEDQLGAIKVGQPATIEIDTYSGLVLTGRVLSISPATGAEFALLPAQNSSGNWVKVVQRVPVRIGLDAGQALPPLRAGMSAWVEIETGPHGFAALFR